MKSRYSKKIIGVLCFVVSWIGCSLEGNAQEVITATADTIHIPTDAAGLPWLEGDTIKMNGVSAAFKPNPKKAVIYSAIFPGLGQVYNRKYWKLPLVYGGFMGFIYAVTWNNKNYRDYSEAYLHVVTDDPTKPDTWHSSWQNFVPAGRDPKDYIANANFRSNLKSGKDYYRRYRDLSIILTVAWYFLCIADSYVDAQLFDFDISSDLSMRLEPMIIPRTSYSPQLYGLNCSIKF
ncbi:DUF5683 domain-containing protein [Tannerella sp.]|uniref:DUF5683 domain-containing protein n=1 Tax=Tannerella sp. TaxID=2382127 RepID=UPI0026DBFA69|nr:DUF5683 domain-containing protein [Tannerella sp.]MDO4704453.1 DUF5683 domain-containing protein [Tannerella sp.]